MVPDPFGRALRDHHRGDRDEPLVQRDGETERDHPVEQFYFGTFDPGDPTAEWIASWLDGPLVDLGAGVGKHALYFQDRFEVVAVEANDHLVEAMRERGVRDARRGDMFAVREQFERDRFRSALAYGTQLGLAGSMQGLRRFLGDLAFVTAPDATAVLDCYDPDDPAVTDLVGYREEPTSGLASRVITFEYEGDVSDVLLFRLFGPDRVREAAVGTGWEVAELERPPGTPDPHYLAALRKR
jgi:hypothetical protein